MVIAFKVTGEEPPYATRVRVTYDKAFDCLDRLTDSRRVRFLYECTTSKRGVIVNTGSRPV